MISVDTQKKELVGMQVPPGDMGKFEEFLQKLGYAHWDESQNPAYKLFLG